jgi:hypothetical protein
VIHGPELIREHDIVVSQTVIEPACRTPEIVATAIAVLREQRRCARRNNEGRDGGWQNPPWA